MHHFNSPKNQKVSDQSRQIPPAAESRGSSPKRSQVKMVVRKGPHLKIVISDGMASPSKIHVPVFGSQLERFADDNAKTSK